MGLTKDIHRPTKQSRDISCTVMQVMDKDKQVNRKFSRIAYTRNDKPRMVLVEYVGDESVAGQYPHGSAVHNNRNHVRTQPHIE